MASNKRLVIVESPTKATRIAGYLGDGYIVESSRGHVRDLPTGAADVPAKLKGEKWARIGVNVDAGFEPLYVVSPDKRQTLRKLKDDLVGADALYLATDEDREGEAIAWHLLAELKPKVPVHRMVFHEITEQAIKDAVAHPRDLDLHLVDAQETRRILDRLYGYEVSPVLWKKVMPRLSAGRVQSVATRLIVDRERDRRAFKPAPWWDVEAMLDAGEGLEPRVFAARLASLGDARVATGRDFDASGQLTARGAIALDQPAAATLAEALGDAAFEVLSVERKPFTRRPSAPFRTTTLQQDAGRKLGFTAERTMRTAQELYEGGFITYMRTDSITLSTSAINAARAQVTQLFGPALLPTVPRTYTSKVKNAQEAHEAIRPAGEIFRTPAETHLTGDQYRLYELIWMRTLASQMVDAKGESMTVRIEATPPSPLALASISLDDVKIAGFAAGGSVITEPGFMTAYVEASDDDAEAAPRLPKLSEGQALQPASITPHGHETKPPARYTEPSLVAKLEELEIGRPSTYASIIRTITSRDYVFKKGTALVPTWLAFAVTRLLEDHFPKLVDYTFTAEMEEDLDDIANGSAQRLAVLNAFYFGDPNGERDPSGGGSGGLRDLVTELGDIDARALSTFPVGDPDAGVVVRVGRYGTYVEDAEGKRANVPEDLPPDELTLDLARQLLNQPAGEERELGQDPETGHLIVAKNGRFGAYVTEVLDDSALKSAKPRTGSLLREMTVGSVTLEQALALLKLPRIVGVAADGAEITAQNGRYGPYLKKGSDSRSLASEEQIFSITLAEAEAIYAGPKQRGRAAAAGPLKELGTDPVSGKPIVVKDGRFGPYVTDGETNATLKRTDSVEEIDHQRAVELIEEKRAKGQVPKQAATRRATPPKTTTRVVKARSSVKGSGASSKAAPTGTSTAV